MAQVLSMLVMPDAEAGAWDAVISSLEEVVAIWRRLGERLQLGFDLVFGLEKLPSLDPIISALCF